MLDKKTSDLLQQLYKHILGDEYVVVAFKDLIGVLPYKSDMESLQQTLEFLAHIGYIKVKYSDEHNICYAMTPKGRLSVEQQNEAKTVVKKERRRLLRYGIMIFGTVLAGTIVGNLITPLFTNFIDWIKSLWQY